MGWFSTDEIVAPTSNAVEGGHHTVQTVALCALAITAAGYIVVKAVMKIQRQQTERLAERAARRAVVQNVP